MYDHDFYDELKSILPFWPEYIQYLPSYYQNEFTHRFLALFESILKPIEWHVDHFDLYLDPGTAPADFLPWLMNWFDLHFDESWSEAKKRMFLKEAHDIFAYRGTKRALRRVLEIYTGVTPHIDDQSEGLAPFTFEVTLDLRDDMVSRQLIEQLIEAHKPVHTRCVLTFASVH
jgi:phage tail-like protein